MKVIKLLVAVLITACLFSASACNFSDEEESSSDSGSGVTPKKEYVFVMPDGAPVLAAVNLMKNYPEIGGHKMKYMIVPASNIGPEFAGNADIAVMPSNAAAKLYNKGIPLNLLSVNIYGVLYMVGTKDGVITDLNALKGHVVYNIGEGKTPDLLLKYFLKEAGTEYAAGEEPIEGKVVLAYKESAAEVLGLLKKGVAEYGVLGQPVVSKALKVAENIKVVFDFQSAWKNITGRDSYPQAGVVVKKAAAADKAFIAALYEALHNNKEYSLNHADEIKGVLADFGSTLKDFDFKAEIVSACNLDCKKAIDEKEGLTDYFNKIAAFDKTFIGGKLPDDGFYLNF